MSSGELSFHNLYEFFHQQREETRKDGCSSEKIVQMASSERKKGFLVLYENSGGKAKTKKKRLRILIPNFPSPPWRRKKTRRKRGESKPSWNGKGKIIILLGYSKHVKISFHYALNAPCASLIMLFSSPKTKAAEAAVAAAAAGNLNAFAEKGSEGIASSRSKGEKKNFSAAPRNVIYFLGKMKMSVRAMRYTALRRSLSLYFGLWFAFHSILELLEIPFCDRVESERERWGKSGLKRFHDNHPRWYISVSTVTINRDFTFQKNVRESRSSVES